MIQRTEAELNAMLGLTPAGYFDYHFTDDRQNAALYLMQTDAMIPYVYAVAIGNGNDGVSRLFPAYYVKTSDPYRLARLALITEFKPQHHEFVRTNAYLTGEPPHGITACLAEGPDGETEMGAALAIVEVFRPDPDAIPDGSDPYAKPVYGDIEAAIGDAAALVPSRAELLALMLPDASAIAASRAPKPRDLANLLNRAAAALETPGDLTDSDRADLIADLCAAGATIARRAAKR